MLSPYEQLGISADATTADLKAAYRAKLKEFPAHSHPEEFKAIRAAYDAIRKGETQKNPDGEFIQIRSLDAKIDPVALEQLKQTAIAHLELSLEDLIRETF
jgi:curved DNA-binding protein CbpA